MNLRHRSEERLPDREVERLVRARTEEEFGHLSPPNARRQRWAAPILALGGALFLLLALVLWPKAPIKPSVAAYGQPRRTVPVGSVPYGPDVWEGGAVDPSFVPGGPLPQGFGISAVVGDTLWGGGDGNVGGAQPPDGEPAQLIEARFRELLAYVRDEVVHRNLPRYPSINQDPAVTTKLPSLAVTLGLDWRNGSGSGMVSIPLGKGTEAQKEFDRVVHNAVRRLTDAVGDSIEFTRRNDPNLP